MKSCFLTLLVAFAAVISVEGNFFFGSGCTNGEGCDFYYLPYSCTQISYASGPAIITRIFATEINGTIVNKTVVPFQIYSVYPQKLSDKKITVEYFADQNCTQLIFFENFLNRCQQEENYLEHCGVNMTFAFRGFDPIESLANEFSNKG